MHECGWPTDAREHQSQDKVCVDARTQASTSRRRKASVGTLLLQPASEQNQAVQSKQLRTTS